jgi:BRCT domain type II-containing protein
MASTKKGSGSKSYNSGSSSSKSRTQSSTTPESSTVSHKQTLDTFKNEVATSLNVNLKQGSSITSREAGSVGGEMVKRMVAYAEKNMK